MELSNSRKLTIARRNLDQLEELIYDFTIKIEAQKIAENEEMVKILIKQMEGSLKMKDFFQKKIEELNG